VLAVVALAALVVPAIALSGSSGGASPSGQALTPFGNGLRGHLVRDPVAYDSAKKNAAARAPRPPKTSARTAKGRPHISFGGVNDTTVTPPDTTGAIGTTRYVQLVNLKFAIFDRTGAQLGSGDLGALTGDSVDNLSDPQVIWDPDTNRFYYAVLDFVSDDMEIGFSKTNSPNSAPDFCKYDVNFGFGSDLPDYPKLGDTADFLLVGANMFAGGIFYTESDVMWAGKPAAGTITSCPAAGSSGWPLATGVKQDLLNSDSTQAFTPVPVNQTDSSSTGYVVSAYDPGGGSANKLEVFQVTKNLNGSANIAGTGSALSVSSFSVPANAPQKGTSAVLDTLDDRLTQAVSGIDPAHGSVAIWTQHAVSGGAGAEERWYEINPGGPNVFQSGTVSSSSLYVFNGAISPDRAVSGSGTGFGSDMVLGFSTSSSTANPAIQMVTKAGTSAQSAIQLVKQSAASNVDFSCVAPYGPPCRWGDYSGATPDPAASLSGSVGQVWLANQYDKSIGNSSDVDWLTWIWSVVPGSSGGGGGAPTIASFAPTSGPIGSQVVITGTNFTNVTSVQLVKGVNSKTVTFTVNSPTQITATVPSGVPTGVTANWKVTTSAGSVTSTGTFLITSGGGGGAPTISSFSPTSGPRLSQVTINGTNFTGATAVALTLGFNSASATFTVNSSTKITATVPSSVPHGVSPHWKVTTPAGSVISSGFFTVL
jgi:hypothetical protein